MSANKDLVRKRYPFAVCHKIRGEGRYRVRRGKYDGRILGTGETAALAWRSAAEGVSLTSEEEESE